MYLAIGSYVDMPAYKTLSGKGSYTLLKAWSWVLLTLLGILTTLAGCNTVENGYAFLCYGVIPPGSVEITGPKNTILRPEYNMNQENIVKIQLGE
jgi:hypothetical protein